MTTVEEERALLTDLLQKQKKVLAKRDRHKKGSAKYRYFKAKLIRIRAKIAGAREWLATHVRPQDKAIGWAMKQVGVTEKPANSNWGYPVQDWIRRTGYTSPVPWCGCFAHEVVVEHGGAHIPSEIHLGYGPSIISDANNHSNGLRAVPFSEARKGDILVFWGGEHIGVCRGRPSLTSIPTIEGNTSPVASGSQYNGGCVAAKSRSRADVSCVARPSY